MSSVAVLVEGSACAWGQLSAKYGEETPGVLIRALVSFTNSHLSMSAANKLIMLAYGAAVIEDRVLFNSRTGDTADASEAIVRSVRQTLSRGISTGDTATHSPLAASLAHAICYLKNHAVSSSTSSVPSTSSTTPSGETSRVVIVSMREEFVAEHSILMNLFFSANKHGICVDVVSLGACSPLLQQAADITSGQFLKVDRPKMLLQTIMTNLLCPFESRSLFPHPSLGDVDFRAGCVCHHKLVDQGWVCSVCLSVLCQYVPICTACGAVFKLNVVPRRTKKRKTGAAAE